MVRRNVHFIQDPPFQTVTCICTPLITVHIFLFIEFHFYIACVFLWVLLLATKYSEKPFWSNVWKVHWTLMQPVSWTSQLCIYDGWWIIFVVIFSKQWLIVHYFFFYFNFFHCLLYLKFPLSLYLFFSQYSFVRFVFCTLFPFLFLT